MAKMYDTKRNKYRWSQGEIVCVVEDAWFEVLDVLNSMGRIDGHDAEDQWLMKVEVRLKDLLGTLAEDPKSLQDEIDLQEIN